jgi:hypothetical protein
VIGFASGQNEPQVKAVLNFFKIDRAEINDLWLELSRAPTYCHMVIDANTKQIRINPPIGPQSTDLFRFLADPGGDSVGATSNLKIDVKKILRTFPEPDLALMHYEFVTSKVPPNFFKSHDYSVELISSKMNNRVVVSLFDYIHSLQSPRETPSREILILHHLLKKHFYMPRSFIRNPKLRD